MQSALPPHSAPRLGPPRPASPRVGVSSPPPAARAELPSVHKIKFPGLLCGNPVAANTWPTPCKRAGWMSGLSSSLYLKRTRPLLRVRQPRPVFAGSRDRTWWTCSISLARKSRKLARARATLSLTRQEPPPPNPLPYSGPLSLPRPFRPPRLPRDYHNAIITIPRACAPRPAPERASQRRLAPPGRAAPPRPGRIPSRRGRQKGEGPRVG